MAGDRKFYMAKGSTYIEKQVNYIKGNQVIGRTEEEADETNDRLKSRSSGSTQDKLEAVKRAINTLVCEGAIPKKQDFSAIRKIVDEMSIFEKITNESFLHILEDCEIPSSLMPSLSTLKVYTFSNRLHPNWKIGDTTPTDNQRIVDLASDFKDLYQTFI